MQHTKFMLDKHEYLVYEGPCWCVNAAVQAEGSLMSGISI